MSRKIVSTNLRFNMAEPDEKRAWSICKGWTDCNTNPIPLSLIHI